MSFLSIDFSKIDFSNLNYNTIRQEAFKHPKASCITFLKLKFFSSIFFIQRSNWIYRSVSGSWMGQRFSM